MDYAQVIPAQITKLPKYSVPRELFICTCVVLILFFLLTIIFAIKWAYRSVHGYTNIDYIPDYAVKYEAQKTMKQIDEQDYTDADFERNCKRMSKLESRMLEFFCLTVVVAINIGTFSCGIMQCVLFGVALILFYTFNIWRPFEDKAITKIVWMLPIISCYLPYYIFSKRLNEQSK